MTRRRRLAVPDMLGIGAVVLAICLAGCQQPSATATTNGQSGENRPQAESDVSAAGEVVAAKPAEQPIPASGTDPDARPIDITFKDVEFGIEKGGAFQRSMLTEKIEGYNGKLIRIRGFMMPTAFDKGIKNFVLLQAANCPFGGPDAYLYHNMIVDLTGGQTTSYTTRPVTVEGRFMIRPFPEDDESHCVSIFHVDARAVSK